MKDNVLRNWKHLRHEVGSIWMQFSPADLDHIAGRRDRLVQLLEHRYGMATSRAEREVDLITMEFEDRLNRAA